MPSPRSRPRPHSLLSPACNRTTPCQRNQSAPLGGAVALVTGARVKIGHHCALKLLRAGATVLATRFGLMRHTSGLVPLPTRVTALAHTTSRFPRDTAARFARARDFDEWRGRLHVHALDLRDVPSIEEFAEHVARAHGRLDVIVHNACQTVRRPPRYYAHLLENEVREECSV